MKLADLQKKLKPAKLDGYLVTRNNMFLNQDVRNDENLLRLLTGFTGSDGSLLILRDKAILFVDGRYELQAPRETDSREVEVFCTKDCSFHRWLAQNTQDLTRFRLGINPWCLTQTEKEALSVNCISVSAVPDFLPPMLSADAANVFEHKLEFAGESAAEKIGRLCNALLREKADAAFFSLADDVSWLFNLRSDALPETPILRAMALVEKNGKAWLFGNNLNTGNLKLDYPLLALSEIPAVLRRFKKKKIMLDPDANAAALLEILKTNQTDIISAPDKIQQFKAVKNPVELAGIRRAHLRDGVAVTKFLCWLDANRQGKTELDIVEKLHAFRAKGDNYFSESFATIAASGPNGAVVHYHPDSHSNRRLDDNSLLLLDSGAQYEDGTTDVTRTVALGVPSREMAENFTLVLKAHIALSSAVFPTHTPGGALDVLARAPLWNAGKDYNHGTGHGVGCFLNVHEGPQRISRSNGAYPLAAGMITSVEPGYYEENRYGIRIENLVEITDAAPELPGAMQFGKYVTSKGVLASVGHTQAEYEDIQTAYEAGYTHATHFYNAMPGFHKRREYKYEGTVESIYLIDDMTVEVVADGIHVPPTILRLVYKIKGVERTCLITDALACAASDSQTAFDPRVIIEDGVCKLADRSALAGSIATMDRLIRTMVQKAEIPLEDAVRMASETPARIMGVYDRKGSLQRGKDADIQILDKDLNVRAVWAMGKLVEGTNKLF